MNHQSKDIIDCISSHFNELDLVMFSHTNRRFKNYLQKSKHKKINLHMIAIQEGYLNILIYLKDISDECWHERHYTTVCTIAAKNKQLCIMEWAQHNGGIWNTDA